MKLIATRRRWGPPLLTALMCIGAFVAVKQDVTQQAQGWVDTPTVELRAPEDAVVEWLAPVGLEVTAGDVVARLVSHELALERAEVANDAQRTLERAARTALDVAQLDQERARELEDARLTLQESEAELAAMDGAMANLEGLVSRGLGDAAELAKLQGRQATLRQRVATSKQRIARLRGDPVTPTGPDLADDPREAALAARAQALELVSPISGEVRSVAMSQFLRTGELVITVVSEQGSMVTACLSENVVAPPLDTRFQVRPLQGGAASEGVVKATGHPLERTDPRCGGHPALPTFAHTIQLELDSPRRAGERVVISR